MLYSTGKNQKSPPFVIEGGGDGVHRAGDFKDDDR